MGLAMNPRQFPEAMFSAMGISAQGIKDAAARQALARFISDPASR